MARTHADVEITCSSCCPVPPGAKQVDWGATLSGTCCRTAMLGRRSGRGVMIGKEQSSR